MQPPKYTKRMTVSISAATKRRFDAIAKDKHVSLNNLFNEAINDQIHHFDGDATYSDRINARLDEVLNSQIKIVSDQRQLHQQLLELTDLIIDVKHQLQHITREDD